MSTADRDGFIWFDGKLVPWRDATVHVLTHTLHYGMGVFEGVRAYDTKNGTCIFRIEEHTQRLINSAKILGMKIPYSFDEIVDAQIEVVRENKLTSGYIRPMCFYGAEGMGLRADGLKEHLIVAAWEWGSYFDPNLKLKGIKLNISKWRRPAPNTIPWDTKASGLYMICTLSKHEAEKDGFTDSLMLDHEGNVAEATGANIFFKDKNGDLHTPIPDSFLDGITRRTVIDIAKSKNIKVNERKILPDELGNFEGCFLTGTAAEVTPVSQIQDFNFKVCNTIIDLSESYQSLVRKKVAA